MKQAPEGFLARGGHPLPEAVGMGGRVQGVHLRPHRRITVCVQSKDACLDTGLGKADLLTC